MTYIYLFSKGTLALSDSDVKECHRLFKKRRGIIPVPMTIMSKYVTALGQDQSHE